MKKRVLTILLILAMVVPMAVTGVMAADDLEPGSIYTADPITPTYFYDQLNKRAKAIYDKLYEEFTGTSKSEYFEGVKTIDLMNVGGIDDDAVEAYQAGNKDIFNDFAAAKDALDLDHPEIWWIDSGYLTFRVTRDGDGYHVLIGPGRGDTYLLAGKKDIAVGQKSMEEMDEEITAKINSIVETAKEKAAAANSTGAYTEADKIAALVRSVHDQIVYGMSYRYETDCTGNEGLYIRTIYALMTQKGVCEAYARSMQVCLSKLGIPCVLIHGIQSKGTPEDHMWNAVEIGGKWYAVDATWDDPVSAHYNGTRDTDTLGEDKKENTNYLLVGQNVIGEYWHPSGYVSTGTFEFTYPTIETSSFNGDTAFGSDDGLRVDYSAGKGSMEDGTAAGVFTMTFQGMNMAKAADQGFYFLIKMYDYHDDGTAHVMNDWYYLAAVRHLTGEDNKYIGDTEDGFRFYTATCEYVEVAVTARKPQNYDLWDTYINWQGHSDEPFFNGTEDEIIAQSGMLYNSNSNYEAPPYVFKQTPIPNAQATAGYEYRFDVIWDDELFHPTSETTGPADNNIQDALKKKVRVRYETVQENLHDPSAGDLYVKLAGELPFDLDRDGYVDMDPATNTYVDFQWHYVCTEEHEHDVNKGCRIDGVSFNFRASDLWQDDITEYRFMLEGVVGSRSKKVPNIFGVVAAVPGLCPCCYRSQGIDWNLWGKPTLLDAPENLDLAGMAREGGTDEAVLAELEKEMNTSGLNGRLMLVVEDKSQGAGSREEYEKINGFLESHKNVGDVIGSSVFEINFNRVCPAVKLKPGESLRVQVGYPAGVTYEDFQDGDVELKAYHFTRCDEKHDCGNSDKAGHKWGDDIVSVEEITLIPTPYGMVIMCNAFSPFEIVAVKRDGAAPVTTDYTVVVVESANGTVEVDGEEALGKNGNVKLTEGEEKTITVTPDAGYVVDTVALGGETLTANSDGTYTITGGENVKSNDVLSVTFVPETVKTEGSVTLVSKACTHEHTEKVKEETPEKLATCTEDGYEWGTVCSDCGTQLTQSHIVHATGHSYENGECSVCHVSEPKTHEPEPDLEPEPGPDPSEPDPSDPSDPTDSTEPSDPPTQPTEPEPTEPQPTEPQPTEPEPTEPEPTEPEPTEPEPTEPEPAGPEPSEVFTDIPESGYEREAVNYVVKHNLIYGLAEDTFSPYTLATRGQVMTILARLNGIDTGSGADWDKAGIQWAIQEGLTTDPASNPAMTRGEMIYMLWVSFNRPAATDQSVLSKFADADKVPAEYLDAMAWAVEKNIMAGVDTGEGKPWIMADSPTQRVMFAAFLMRAENSK